MLSGFYNFGAFSSVIMIQRILPLFLLIAFACANHGPQFSDDSYALAVEGVYEGRIITQHLDTTSYRIELVALSDSTVRVQAVKGDEISSFINWLINEKKSPICTIS